MLKNVTNNFPFLRSNLTGTPMYGTSLFVSKQVRSLPLKLFLRVLTRTRLLRYG
jgi:hypothetical protein